MGIPGLSSTLSSTSSGMGLSKALQGMSITGGTVPGGKLSKAQKKNERRKIKRRFGADGEELEGESSEEEEEEEGGRDLKKEEAPDSWDNGEEEEEVEAKRLEALRVEKETEEKTKKEEEKAPPAGGEESKIRALKKKLRQVRLLSLSFFQPLLSLLSNPELINSRYNKRQNNLEKEKY